MVIMIEIIDSQMINFYINYCKTAI